eukprot:jgi/Orpsp1_1/1190217/evm.model.d7180000077499.1
MYLQGKPYSKFELKEIITLERNKIPITDTFYKNAISKNNISALKILLENDNPDNYITFYRIKKYHILEKSIDMNNLSLLKTVLKFSPFTSEGFYTQSLLKKSQKKNNPEIMKLLIKSLINSSIQENLIFSVNYNSSNFNYILNMIIRLNNINMVKYLLENNKYKFYVNINEKDINNEYPLFTAFHENIEIFKYLLDLGADRTIKNNNGVSLLTLSILHHKYVHLQYLLNDKININEKDISGNYPLITAIYQNDLDIVISIVEYCLTHSITMNIMDASGNTPLILSYNLGHKDIFEYLVDYFDINRTDINGNTVLYYAIEKEDDITITYLMNHQADCTKKNKYNMSCLDKISSKGGKFLISFLKNNSNNLLLNSPNDQHDIPLSSIIKNNTIPSNEKEEIIKLLILNGSNVNYVDKNKDTPLIHAIETASNSLSIVKLLVKYGANINYYNVVSGKTIIKYAIDKAKKDIVNYLIECNVNVNYNHFQAKPLFGNRCEDIRDTDIEIVKSVVLKLCIQNVTGNMVYKIIKGGELDVLKILVNLNYDINIKDSMGYNAFMNALYFKNVPIINYLISLGNVDYLSLTNNGESVVDYNKKAFGNSNSSTYNTV